MFAALKRETGRRAGKGRKRQTWSWKKNSSRSELLVGLALNRLLTVESTTMKVRFASGVCTNKFAAFPRRNQTRMSFVISWEKVLGWNFLPFNRSSWSSKEDSYARFFDSTFSPNLSEFRLRSEPMFAPKPASLLQDLMHTYHKRAHIPFEHSGRVKNRIASKKRTASHLPLSRSRNEVICIVRVMQA